MTNRTVPAPAGGHTIVFPTDVHLMAVSEEAQLHPALRLVMKFIKEFRPEVVIWGGDFLNMQAISPHARKGSNLKELEMQRLSLDYQLGQRLLEELRPCCDYMEYLEGNHEHWAVRLMEEFPGLTGLLDVATNLTLSELGIGWTDINKVLRFGKPNFTHGWYVNKYHARRHLDEMGDHIIYGHTHDHQKVVKPVRASREPFLAMSCGCLCDLNPHYKRNRPNDWMHGFGLIEVAPSGNFAAHFIPIINREFIWDRFLWKL